MGDAMRINRSNPKKRRWCRHHVPAIWAYAFGVLPRCGCLGFELLWSWMSVTLHGHVAFAAPAALGHCASLLSSFRILECDLQNTNDQLGHKYIACVKNTYKESRSLKRWYLNSTQSKAAKRTWHQRSGTAQQHIEQPERARGRELLQLSTASFHFQNKYWMLWLIVVCNLVHNIS